MEESMDALLKSWGTYILDTIREDILTILESSENLPEGKLI